MTPTLPVRIHHPADRAMRQVAAVATAIVVAALAALAGALLSWHALAADGSAQGAAAAGIALASQGGALVVDGLGRDGAAARAGMRVGDVVEAVDGAPVAGVTAADRALAAAAVDIRVRRGDKALLIHLPPDRSPALGQPHPADRGR